jgi:oligopeptide/dipeptide ABC transporter ATP-binding protein
VSGPSNTPLLSVRNAQVSFSTARGPLRAVDGVSFDLHAGQTLGIVGESGSGKSVLVRSLIGLVGESSGAGVAGQVLFEGRDLRSLSPRELRSVLGTEIGIVFQDPMTSLNPVMKIGRQIGEGLRLNRGLDSKAAARRAVELLNEVGIPEPERRAVQYPHEMSGGMRQRVAIAIAIACAPKLLIADEPTTALDVTVQAQILDLLRALQRELGMAVILITHDLGVIAEFVQRVIVFYAARAVEHGPVKPVFRAPLHPYTEGLLRSIPHLEGKVARLQAIDGVVPQVADLPPGCRFHPRCRHAAEACARIDPPLLAFEAGREAACIRHTGYARPA